VHLTSSPVDWYAARAAGVVAYLLLTTVVLLGLAMSTRRRWPSWPRFAIEDVHRFASLLAGTFLVIHIVTIAIDAYLPFSLSSIIVPFTSAYRPAWVGFGIVAAELLAALAVANRLRRRMISYRTWRKTHYLTFAVWAGATLHGLGSGTDRSTPWMTAIWVAATGAVVAATCWRVLAARGATASLRHGAALGAGALVAAGAVAVVTGPLQFRAKPWNAGTFTDTMQGHVVRNLGRDRGVVSLAARGEGDQRVLLRADLLIAPTRLLSTSFQMEYLPSGAACRGRVTHVDGDGLGFVARCRMADGRRRTVNARWDQPDVGDQLAGTVTSTEA
jgi:sulfoxide reductase heme-binding subunit YedZ